MVILVFQFRIGGVMLGNLFDRVKKYGRIKRLWAAYLVYLFLGAIYSLAFANGFGTLETWETNTYNLAFMVSWVATLVAYTLVVAVFVLLKRFGSARKLCKSLLLVICLWLARKWLAGLLLFVYQEPKAAMWGTALTFLFVAILFFCLFGPEVHSSKGSTYTDKPF